MKKRSQIIVEGSAILRAILALAFVVFTMLQPAMFAVVNAQSPHPGISFVVDSSAVDHSKHVQRHQSAAEEPGTRDMSPDHQDKPFADKGCEVHCAPVTAVPVVYQALQRPVDRSFELVLASVLTDGEYAELVRPPRT
ncbi:MAG: hypothetical protein VYB05_08315 [Pseudomonadota bacterium]|nr:hypothetical protein [Pseudomonadota bacterium]